MTEKPKRPERKTKIEKLDLNPETVQDLTEQESERVQGGARAGGGTMDATVCWTCAGVTGC